jgi:hypothetical protein
MVDQFLISLLGAGEIRLPMMMPRKPAGMPKVPAEIGLMSHHFGALTPKKG